MQLDYENYFKNYYVEPILIGLDERAILKGRNVNQGHFSFKEFLTFDHNDIITAPPGYGKTSLLKYIEYIAQSTIYYDSIYIPLSNFHDGLLETIEISYTRKKTIFLLDGYDEMPFSLRGKAIYQINALSKKYPNARFLLTSRLVTHQISKIFDSPFFFRISELNDFQIDDLFNNHGINKFSDKYAKIQSLSNIKGLLRIPLTASFILNNFAIFDSNDFFVDPTFIIKNLIYNEIYIASETLAISEKTIEKILIEIAVSLHFSGKQSLSIIDLNCIVTDILSKSDNTFSAEHFLDFMKQRGRFKILNNKDSSIFSFAHIIIFEYFLTKYIKLSNFPYNEYPIIDTSESVPMPIKLKGLKGRDSLVKTLNNIKDNLRLTSRQVTPIYARNGSIEILLFLSIGSATIYAFKKFADGYFTKLGHLAAEEYNFQKSPIELPDEIKDNLPQWIRENNQAMEIFTTELIHQYARNEKPDGKKTATIAINSLLMSNYNNNYEQITNFQFNNLLQQINEYDRKTIG